MRRAGGARSDRRYNVPGVHGVALMPPQARPINASCRVQHHPSALRPSRSGNARPRSSSASLPSDQGWSVRALSPSIPRPAREHHGRGCRARCETPGGSGFTLEEGGLAGRALGVVCGHWSISLKTLACLGRPIADKSAPTRTTQPVGADLSAIGWPDNTSLKPQCSVRGPVGICTWINADSSNARSASISCIEAIIRIDADGLGCSSNA